MIRLVDKGLYSLLWKSEIGHYIEWMHYNIMNYY